MQYPWLASQCWCSRCGDNENDDYDEIWVQLYDDATKLDADILNIVASYIRLCHALKHDPVYQAVMETVDYAMHINKAKTFNNALDFALETRKFLILQAYAKAKTIARKDGKQWALDSTGHKQWLHLQS